MAFVSLLGKDLLFLLDGKEGRGDVELMDHDTGINPWHVLGAPSKDVLIIL